MFFSQRQRLVEQAYQRKDRGVMAFGPGLVDVPPSLLARADELIE
jgi:hypothetical protein